MYHECIRHLQLGDCLSVLGAGGSALGPERTEHVHAVLVAQKVATELRVHLLSLFPALGWSAGYRHRTFTELRQVCSTQARMTRRTLGWWPMPGEDWSMYAIARQAECLWSKAKVPLEGRGTCLVVVPVGPPLRSLEGPTWRPRVRSDLGIPPSKECAVRWWRKVLEGVLLRPTKLDGRRLGHGHQISRTQSSGRRIAATCRHEHKCRHAMAHRGTRSHPFAADGFRLPFQNVAQDIRIRYAWHAIDDGWHVTRPQHQVHILTRSVRIRVLRTERRARRKTARTP